MFLILKYLVAVGRTHIWYVMIAPEMIKDNLERLQNSLELIEGNIKYYTAQTFINFLLSFSHNSLGNMKLYLHYADKAIAVPIDSESLDDQKAQQYELAQFGIVMSRVTIGDFTTARACIDKVLNMSNIFPNAQAEFPAPVRRHNCHRFLALICALEEEWELSMQSLRIAFEQEAFWNFSILPFFTHINFFSVTIVNAALILYERNKQLNNDDTKFLKKLLLDIRGKLDMFGKALPGTHRCAGTAFSARITLALQDRSFGNELEKLEKALAYTEELDCLPLDVIILQCDIARWKGEIEALNSAIKKIESIGYHLVAKTQKRILKKLQSGELSAVDLSFVPDNKGKEEIVELSDQEKLEQLEQAITEAKAEMNNADAAGDEEAALAARKKAKALKKEKKELKKRIETGGSTSVVDQAKIEEIKSKIADAKERRNQAFDEDDDDAEEAAATEVRLLGKELAKLTGSTPIPKKN